MQLQIHQVWEDTKMATLLLIALVVLTLLVSVLAAFTCTTTLAVISKMYPRGCMLLNKILLPFYYNSPCKPSLSQLYFPSNYWQFTLFILTQDPTQEVSLPTYYSID